MKAIRLLSHFLLPGVTLLAALQSQAAETPKFAKDIRVVQNVDYLEKGREEKADLYFPLDIPKGKLLPAVLIIHGGGWIGGQRNAEREIVTGTMLAEHGYVGMSIDYLLSKN